MVSVPEPPPTGLVFTADTGRWNNYRLVLGAPVNAEMEVVRVAVQSHNPRLIESGAEGALEPSAMSWGTTT